MYLIPWLKSATFMVNMRVFMISTDDDNRLKVYKRFLSFT